MRANPCEGLDSEQACFAVEGCEPRSLEPDEPGYPGTFCGWVGVPGEPGYTDPVPGPDFGTPCDPNGPDVCGGSVCVPVLDECRDACSSDDECLDGFYCGDNGTGVRHCADCDEPPGYANRLDPSS